jgi:hypothetical protein
MSLKQLEGRLAKLKATETKQREALGATAASIKEVKQQIATVKENAAGGNGGAKG